MAATPSGLSAGRLLLMAASITPKQLHMPPAAASMTHKQLQIRPAVSAISMQEDTGDLQDATEAPQLEDLAPSPPLPPQQMWPVPLFSREDDELLARGVARSDDHDVLSQFATV